MTTSLTGEQALRAQDPDAPLISLVIPTFNEAGNIPELLTRLASSVPEDVPCEVIFVDDSTDDTPRVITCLLYTSPSPRD